MKMVQLVCSVCGKTFQRYSVEHERNLSNGRTRVFCSRRCLGVQNSKDKSLSTITKSCERCGKKFTTTNTNRKFCSVKCSSVQCGEQEKLRWIGHVPKKWVRPKRCRDDNWKLGCALTEDSEMLRRKNISLSMKAGKKSGGHRRGSGIGKKGWYKGYWCDSSWELSWIIYQLEHQIPFVRNTESFTYQYNGQTKKYFPDFLIGDTYVEIKGYETEQWKSKLSQFNRPLIVIDKHSIKPYIEYVVGKYGHDYTNLYEMESKIAEEQSPT